MKTHEFFTSAYESAKTSFQKMRAKERANIALVIDGSTFDLILKEDNMENYFAMLSFACKTVIACKFTPKQKAQLAKFRINSFNWIPKVLAIGDGANDALMIKEANVGVAVSCEDNFSTKKLCDTKIPKFKYLPNLLLVHRKNNFTRPTKVITYTF